jgi:hypothetical protein
MMCLQCILHLLRNNTFFYSLTYFIISPSDKNRLIFAFKSTLSCLCFSFACVLWNLNFSSILLTNHWNVLTINANSPLPCILIYDVELHIPFREAIIQPIEDDGLDEEHPCVMKPASGNLCSAILLLSESFL